MSPLWLRLKLTAVSLWGSYWVTFYEMLAWSGTLITSSGNTVNSVNYNTFTGEYWKAHLFCKCNCVFETERLLNVTGSQCDNYGCICAAISRLKNSRIWPTTANSCLLSRNAAISTIYCYPLWYVSQLWLRLKLTAVSLCIQFIHSLCWYT